MHARHGQFKQGWQGHLARLLSPLLGLLVLALSPFAGAQGPTAESISPSATTAANAELAALAVHGARYPGAPGNLALEAQIMARFAATGYAHGALAYEAPVFQPGPASVRVGDGEPVRLLTLHPTLMRPGNFAKDEFTARLIYLGMGTNEDLTRLNGQSLQGAVAVLEYHSGDAWMRLMRFGLRGFIFLPGKDYEHQDSVDKIYNTEVAMPRYFVPPADAPRLRAVFEQATGPLEAQFNCQPSAWKPGRLRSPWVLIPGKDAQLANEVVVLTAPLDANSIVPELATGASTLANLAILTQTLAKLQAEPPARSVLLVAVNGHTQRFLGERMLAWYLLAATADVEDIRNLMAREMRQSQLYSDNYRKLRLESCTEQPQQLSVAMDVLWRLDLANQKGAETVENVVEEDVRLPDLSQVDDAVLLAHLEAVLATYTEEANSLLTKAISRPAYKAHLAEQISTATAMRDAGAADLRAILGRIMPVFHDEKLLEAWRTSLDDSTGTRVPIKGKLQDEAKRNLNVLKLELLEVIKNEAMAPEKRQALIDQMNARKADLSTVLILFNKLDIGFGREKTRYRQLATQERLLVILRQNRDDLITKFQRWAELKREFIERDSANDHLVEAMGSRKVALVLNLNLTFQSEGLGFISHDKLVKNTSWQRQFGTLTQALAKEVANGDAYQPMVDTLTVVGGRPEGHYFFHTDVPLAPFHLGGTPALSLLNTYADHGPIFSPDDTLARVPQERVTRALAYLDRFLPALINHKEITTSKNLPKVEMAGRYALWSSIVRTFKVDEFDAKTTPSQEVPHCYVAIYPPVEYQPVVAGQVLNAIIGMSDATGCMVVQGLDEFGVLAPLAYELDPTHREVTHTIDRGRIQESLQLLSNMTRAPGKTLPLFKSLEFPILDRVDPTIVAASARPISVQQYWPMSALMKAQPQKYGAHGISTLSKSSSHATRGPAAVYMVKKEQEFNQEALILMTSGKRAAVNPTSKDPEGQGYKLPRDLGHDFTLRAAQDMAKLNEYRVGRMHGVTNQLVKDFMAQGAEALETVAQRQAQLDHVGYLQSLALALGNQVKAYELTRAMNTDMLNAIICYMALMVPFCFFLMKLLFKLVRIEHQAMVFIALFVVTYLGFRLIHPAFAIALNPEAIFVAFLLSAVGIFITWIMHQRFEGEMQVMFQTYAGMQADVGYSTVGQQAMLIGVNNMKRRRVRTMLTTATIVLVTFAMLSFSSVSQKMSPRIIVKQEHSPYSGLFFHWAGGKGMDHETVQVFRDLFGDRGQVVVRYLLQGASDAKGNTYTWRVENLTHPASPLEIEGLVGLPPIDRNFLGEIPLMHGRFFDDERAAETIICGSAAEALKLGPEDLGTAKVRVLGRELTIVGIMDDDRYRLLRDLNPILPLMPLRPLSQGAQGTEAPPPVVPGAEEEGLNALPVDTSSMLIVPSLLAKAMGARPLTISVRFPDEEGLKAPPLGDEMALLLNVTQARFFIGSRAPFRITQESKQDSRPGVYYVSSSFRTSIGGLAKLLIPLIIAGSIILNTMLGTVYERKSEIAIYNAIGLNPTHIFMFFLAEAFVYAVIGSVGGYLIGQILSLIIAKFELVEGLNINFSSLMVVYAILFTITLVLLSTIYPAMVATRTAVPSGKRKWSLPKHDGQRMDVAFPFIYQPKIVLGVMFYLYEYFGRYSEKSLGDQIANLNKLDMQHDDKGRPIYLLEYGLALAPYDLGVTQTVTFTAKYDDIVQSYRVHMLINRTSGQDSNWVTVNKPYLEKLRALLIRWRNLDSTQHSWYVEQARLIYTEAGFPVPGPELRHEPAAATPSPTAGPSPATG